MIVFLKIVAKLVMKIILIESYKIAIVKVVFMKILTCNVYNVIINAIYVFLQIIIVLNVHKLIEVLYQLVIVILDILKMKIKYVSLVVTLAVVV